MNSKGDVSRALKVLAELIDRMSEQEFEQLLTGRGALRLPPRARRKGTSLPDLKPDLADLARRLDSCRTREEAHQLLSTLDNRKVLNDLARFLKIHTIKSDRREHIEQKIVESVIGGRLRNEAIRSLNMGRDRSDADESST